MKARKLQKIINSEKALFRAVCKKGDYKSNWYEDYLEAVEKATEHNDAYPKHEVIIKGKSEVEYIII